MDLGTHRWSVDHAAVTRLQLAAQAALGPAPGPFASVAGVRPMSPDWSPQIGPDTQGVLIADGHARNGWLLAPLTGAMIAAYVFDDPIAPLWAAFTPQRFEERR
jgi:glycine oxidase